MIQYAVMGNPIRHSLSPLIHQHFAKQFDLVFQYEKRRVEPAHFEAAVDAFFKAGGLGLNITAPLKEQAFLLSQQRTPRCLTARAANTLWQADGQYQADTTDGIGLMRDLNRHLNCMGKRLLILGAGGAVRGILSPLLESGLTSLTIANRTHTKAIALQKEFDKDASIEVCEFEALKPAYDLIINATGSAFPRLASSVVREAELCYDLSYAHDGLTPFVEYARAQGCNALDGFGMLVCQAAESFRIWHGVMPDVSILMERQLKAT